MYVTVKRMKLLIQSLLLIKSSGCGSGGRAGNLPITAAQSACQSILRQDIEPHVALDAFAGV